MVVNDNNSEKSTFFKYSRNVAIFRRFPHARMYFQSMRNSRGDSSSWYVECTLIQELLNNDAVNVNIRYILSCVCICDGKRIEKLIIKKRKERKRLFFRLFKLNFMHLKALYNEINIKFLSFVHRVTFCVCLLLYFFFSKKFRENFSQLDTTRSFAPA